MDRKYTIVESVGPKVEAVRNYRDLEKHHPTWPEDHARRHYAEIRGEREEYAISPSGERMVSKDFVLKIDGDARVDVPSPFSGFIRRSARLDRWGTVEIYDGRGEDANLVARVRHMQPICVKNGEKVELGQPLGVQGRKAPGKVGLHTHMDIAESRVEEFDAFVRALDAGDIRERNRRQQVVERHNSDKSLDPLSIGQSGSQVRHLQGILAGLGYRNPDGTPLVADGRFGSHTRAAVEAFQREHGLRADGVVGERTQRVLAATQANPLADRAHPQHALYAQALRQVHADEAHRQLAHGRHSEHLAAALAVAAGNAGVTRIDRIEVNAAGTLARAVQVGALRDEPGLNRTTPPVDIHRALATPLHAHGAHAAMEPGPSTRQHNPEVLRPESDATHGRAISR